MKVLLVNKFLYPRGGAETYFLKVGKELEKMSDEDLEKNIRKYNLFIFIG